MAAERFRRGSGAGQAMTARRNAGGGPCLTVIAAALTLLALSALPEPLRAEEGVFSLAGKWEYRKGFDEPWIAPDAGGEWKEITVPSVFNDHPDFRGYAGMITLRRRVPSGAVAMITRGEPVAVNSGVVSAAGRMYFNGVLLGTVGSFSPFRSGRDQWIVAYVPERAFSPGHDSYIGIVLCIPPHGMLNGLKGPEITVGRADSIFKSFNRGIIVSAALITLYLFFGIYHLLLSVRKPRERQHLYLGLLCVCFSTYILGNSQILRYLITDENDFLYFLIDKAPLYLTLPSLALFISWLYHGRHTLFSRIVTAITAMIILFALAAEFLFPRLRFLFYTPFIILALLVIAQSFHETVKQMRKKNMDAYFLFIGILLLGAGAVHDWLVLEGIVISNMIIPYIYAAVVVGASCMLIHRFSVTYDVAERLNEELSASVADLEAMNEEHKKQNEELMRSENDLSMKESFIRRILENAPAAIYRVSFSDSRFSFDYVSPHVSELTGYSPEEMRNNPDLIRGLIPDKWLDIHAAFWERAERGDIEPVTVYPILHRSGERRWIEQRSVLIAGKNGQPAGIEAFCTDITGHKLAEDVLRRNEEKYRSLVENINEVIFTLDENGVVTYISPVIRSFSGYNPEDVLGKEFISFIYPDDREILKTRFHDLSRGVVVPYDYRIVSAGGEPRWVRSFSHPLYVRGRFAGISGIITDIHEQRLAEDALRESEERFKQLYENAGVTIFILDNGRIIHCNRKTLEMFGRSMDEIIGQNPAELSPKLQPDGRPSREKARDILKAAVAGEPQHFEWLHERPGGTVFDAEVIMTATNMRSGVFVQAIVRDISDRKETERENEHIQAQLLQAQKMEAIGTLAGGIAHDFNNMLGGIIGSLNLLELLAEKEELRQKNEIVTYLDTAMEASQRAADLTRQLLTLSRRQGLRLAPLDIAVSLKHVEKICKNSFPKSVQLDFRIGEEKMRVHADPIHIEQLILNLCVNASHAMTIMRGDREDEGGVLTVNAARFTADAGFCASRSGSVPGENYIKISVADTGIGMSEDTRKRIFDPFFTTKEMDTGTGLGLAMAYTIVKEHRGFIDVTSVEGEGTVFTVFLPEIAGEGDAWEPRKERDGIVAGSGLVLVIDDERVILNTARRMLEKCGYDVITAQSGQEGVDAYVREGGRVIAVVLDLSMPKMSGLAVYDMLKEVDPSVKVLLASGFIENETIDRAMERGISEFIRKPYTVEELSRKIKKILD